MSHASLVHSPLSSDEFESFASIVMGQAPRLSANQMLELADRLHETIRTRRVAERSFSRRNAPHEPSPMQQGF
jgi:hypothetical protein